IYEENGAARDQKNSDHWTNAALHGLDLELRESDKNFQDPGSSSLRKKQAHAMLRSHGHR
ncbi:MAG TPA: hypothetical protein VGA94_03855, partial [Thermodesulfobacteriota bacterium]